MTARGPRQDMVPHMALQLERRTLSAAADMVVSTLVSLLENHYRDTFSNRIDREKFLYLAARHVGECEGARLIGLILRDEESKPHSLAALTVLDDLGGAVDRVPSLIHLQQARSNIGSESGDKEIVSGITLDDVAQMVRVKVARAFHRQERMEEYRRVRGATFKRLTPDMLPKIIEAHRSSWLSNEALAEFLDDPEAFERRAEKGLFVKGIEEQHASQQRIIDWLCEGTSGAAPDPNGAAVGYVLESDDREKKILAFYYGEDVTDDPPPPFIERRRTMFERGFSGSGLHYSKATDFRAMFSDVRSIHLGSTLWGGVPFAASRLFPLALEDTARRRPHINMFVDARLRNFLVDPPPFGLAPDIGDNYRSSTFFRDRRVKDFAEETAHMDPFIRFVDGDRYEVTPVWQWFYAHFDRLRQRSSDIWTNIRAAFGDFEEDNVKPAM